MFKVNMIFALVFWISYIKQRTGPTEVKSLEEVYSFLKPGELVAGTDHPIFARYW